MKVMKFGGTSVGSPERMKGVASLVTESGEPTFIVLSAMSGTTNSLVEISDYLYKKNPEGANEVINNLEKKYMQHVEELYSTEEMKNTTREFLQGEFNYLRSFTKDLFTSFEEKSIVAQGEIMSTNMVANYLEEQGVKVCLLSALDFMRTDKNAEPDSQYIKEKLGAIMKENEQLMKQFAKASDDARTVFITGSGTASMEAVVMNVFTPADKVLVVNGGSFGHRFVQLCEIHEIPHTEIKLEMGTPLTAEDLKPYEGQGYTGFLVNLHETSTGVLYDIQMISDFCHRNHIFLAVDSISSFLADPFNMKEDRKSVV